MLIKVMLIKKSVFYFLIVFVLNVKSLAIAFLFPSLFFTSVFLDRLTKDVFIYILYIGLWFMYNFMTPFYGWGSTASRLDSLRGGSLLFTTKFPEIPGTHFIDLGRMKC